MSALDRLAVILPDTAGVNEKGRLTIGGCDVVELADGYGTPLYIFDESTLRRSCRDYTTEFGQRYPDVEVIYAAKASLNQALATVIKDEGLGLDVVSGGELSIARAIDFPMEKVYLHGNNKLRTEIELALSSRVGRIVIDNLQEISMIDRVAEESGVTQDVLLRLTPGIDAHTHRHVATGIIDSKFGLPIASGQAEQALVATMSASNIKLIGLHVHLGSLISSAEPYEEAIKAVFQFAAVMREKHGFEFREFSPGGGFAIQYTREAPAPDINYFAGAITRAVKSNSDENRIDPPRLVIEPGRAIVGRSGVAVYRAGTIKDIPGVRKYVSVDGGMADNIRPALYGSQYEALIANKVEEEDAELVSIAGKFCESGDILVKDIPLPKVVAGDTIVIPVTGAYCLPLASNYNASLKPAIVMLAEGKARIIRNRESYDDLIRHDAA